MHVKCHGSTNGALRREFDNVQVLIGENDGHPCPHGWLRENELCTLCPAGFSCIGEAKYACPPGTYSPRGHRGCEACECGANFTWCSATTGYCQCGSSSGGFDCSCRYDVCEEGAGGEHLPECVRATALDVIPFVALPQHVEIGIAAGAAAVVLACVLAVCHLGRRCCRRKPARATPPQLTLATTRSGRIVGAAFADDGGRPMERSRSVSPASTSRLIALESPGHVRTQPRRRKSWKVAKLGRSASAASRGSVAATEVRLMEPVSHPNSVLGLDEDGHDGVPPEDNPYTSGHASSGFGARAFMEASAHAEQPTPRRPRRSRRSHQSEVAEFDMDDPSYA